MSGNQGYIVFLWLTPLVLLLLIPLFLLLCRFTYTFIFFVFSTLLGILEEDPILEKRQNRRINGDKVGALVTNRTGKVIGKVQNISACGICISGLAVESEELGYEISLLSGESNVFTLLIQPKWQRLQKTGVILGASILNNPVGWPEYITAAE